MQPLPENIADFIQRHHVITLATYADNHLWAASCFYAFDPDRARLIILTSRHTTHGQMMLTNPHIVGTIAAQPIDIQDIEGIQFTAIARLFINDEYAYQHYLTRHPIAAHHRSDLWEIQLESIKYSENRSQFAAKHYWTR